MGYLSLSWLVWLWLTVGLYWLAPRSVRPYVLIGLSLAFMASVDLLSLGLLVWSGLLTYIGASYIRLTKWRLLVIGSVIAGTLIAFKLRVAVEADYAFQFFGIPLGLSYYTFRCLHVLFERFKGNIAPPKANELAAYLFFMPTFMVGPIHRIETFVRDFHRQRFDFDQLRGGAERILIGYFKIVVLSNFIVEGMLGDAIESLEQTNAGAALYLTIVQDGLNIYLQFSGHCDIAIGFAAMVGYRIIENFDAPYLKPNISEFWKSWHISLSRWCREYIYAPVVAKTRNPALGAITTMIVIGLWHEISFRYLLWGLYHGLGIVVWQLTHERLQRAVSSLDEVSQRVVRIVSIIFTVHFVWFGFIILTTPSLSDIPARLAVFLGGGSP